MNLRQYLIAPHERSHQPSARRDTPVLIRHDRPTTCSTRILDPRLIDCTRTTPNTLLRYENPAFLTSHSGTGISHHDGRSTLAEQQQQKPSTADTISREQVIRGLSAYPDILAAILRSGHISDQNPNDTRASEHHIDIPSIASQAITTPSQQTNTTSPFQQTTHNPTSSPATAASSTPTTKPSLSTSTTPSLCFWYYHRGHCVNDPTSPAYQPSGRPCPFLHSTEGIEEIRVQPGKEHWHKRIGDCGLELCKFSSNYRYTEDIELSLQQKKEYRKWKG
jgi:hypothetical protein